VIHIFAEIPLIELRAYQTTLTGIDNDVITEQILSAGRPIDPTRTAVANNPAYEDTEPPDTPEIRHMISEIHDAIDVGYGRLHDLTEFWATILMPGQTTVAHSHRKPEMTNPLDHLAFAYYTHAPEGSVPLTFHVGYCHLIENTIEVPVQTGQLIVFNAFVLHFTDRHLGDFPRVNVSGNLTAVDAADTSVAWKPDYRRLT